MRAPAQVQAHLELVEEWKVEWSESRSGGHYLKKWTGCCRVNIRVDVPMNSRIAVKQSIEVRESSQYLAIRMLDQSLHHIYEVISIDDTFSLSIEYLRTLNTYYLRYLLAPGFPAPIPH